MVFGSICFLIVRFYLDFYQLNFHFVYVYFKFVVFHVCVLESVSLITRFENSVGCGVFYISSEILKSFPDNFS